MFADPHTAGPLDKAAILRRFRRALKAAQLEQSHRFKLLRDWRDIVQTWEQMQ